ncbi:hypothetical protein HAALTHF_15800n [Vreelandella aquamarina]|nr:hypothetical protein HAALTHF_15800n [Halomonas axialensis]
MTTLALSNCRAATANPAAITTAWKTPSPPDGTPVLGKRYEVAARGGRAVRLKAGQTIRIINTHGTQVCDTWAFSTDNINEFMSWEHGRAWLSALIPQAGDPLISNRRRPIMTPHRRHFAGYPRHANGRLRPVPLYDAGC